MRLFLVFALSIQLFAAESDWQSLFNGKDLSGWVPVNVAPNTFMVRDGLIVSTGKPTGVMRTERQYENFELELEWKHLVSGGNAGLFVWSDPVTARGQPFTRAIEVQILDGRQGPNYTSDGDVFSIHGARFTPDRPHPAGWERSLPTERRAKPAGEWNHYRVVCNKGDIKLAVNGIVVSGGYNASPRKGYICLEAEGSEAHFRNIRIRELPSNNVTPEQTAGLAEGFVSIYDGLGLSGWKQSDEHARHWKANDWILECDGKCEAKDPNLSTTRTYGDFVMICDWRWKEKTKPHLLVRGVRVDVPGESPSSEWNRYVITVDRGQVTVDLNGKTMVDRQQLAGLPATGPIILPHPKTPIQYANIYIKELR
jgi:hypothetical protein